MTTVDDLVSVLVLIAALGCGLMAGLFFAFSAFVMRGLARLPPAQGVAAMQSINAAVANPWFMTAFLGTPAACVLVLIVSPFWWQQPGAFGLLSGSLLYLLGGFLVTIVVNVPMNNRLAVVRPAEPDSAALWSRYVSEWTAWNHVRTLASLAAAALLTAALR